MNAPLRLNDLVLSVDIEPRIPDLTLADRLGFSKPHNVRKLIERSRSEMALHGAVVVREASFLRDGENPEARKRGGRPGIMYFLNEGQALVICALSRTPIAAKVRQDIIAVYMAHRRGEWCPAPTRRERQALHFLATNSCVIEAGEPVYFDNDHGFVGLNRKVLLSHITDTVLDTLAEFENDEVILTDDELDQDAGEMLERDLDTDEGDSDVDGEEDRADAEPDLGWCNNVGQLRLGEGHGDGDSTAPERHGGGFVRCAPDDAEPSLGAVNPITGILCLVAHTPRGPLYIEPGIDQTRWSLGGTHDRELDADLQEGDTLDEQGEGEF